MSGMLFSIIGTVLVTNLFLWLLLRFMDLIRETHSIKKQEQLRQEKENELAEVLKPHD